MSNAEHIEVLQAILDRGYMLAEDFDKLSKIIAALTPTAATTEPAGADTCLWAYDDNDYAPMWNTACGEAYSFVEGGPEDNGHKFCHGCGKPLKIAALTAEREGGV